MLISLASIFVTDQDRARDFYTGVLGFEVHTDESYGSDTRWITLTNSGGGLQLGLEPASGPALDFQKALYDAGTPATAFISTDLDTEHAELVKKGVTFTVEPTRMDYGGYDAIFDDTCGNLICLHQLDQQGQSAG